MTLEGLLIILLVGAIAGWLATMVFSRWGFGLGFNIVIGILGGLLGTWLFPKLGVSLGSGLVSAILVGTLGAIIILFVVFGLQRIGFVSRRRL